MNLRKGKINLGQKNKGRTKMETNTLNFACKGQK